MNQEKLMEFQMMEQQLQQLNQNLQNLEAQRSDLMINMDNLDKFKEIKVGNKILFPVANGIFAEAELKNNSSFRVNVGNGVVVGKTVDEAKTLIEEQVSEINKYLDETVNYQQQIYQRMHEIKQDLKKEQE